MVDSQGDSWEGLLKANHACMSRKSMAKDKAGAQPVKGSDQRALCSTDITQDLFLFFARKWLP